MTNRTIISTRIPLNEFDILNTIYEIYTTSQFLYHMVYNKDGRGTYGAIDNFPMSNFLFYCLVLSNVKFYIITISQSKFDF